MVKSQMITVLLRREPAKTQKHLQNTCS